MLTRVMAHRRLADPKPFHLQQHRQESMHAIIQFDRRQTVPSVDAERTPNIDDVIVQDVAANAVGDLRGQAPQPRILPALSNATDHIVVVECLQQARDIAGIVLQVGVQGHYHSPADLFEAGIQRSTLPGVLAQANNPDLRLLSREVPQQLRRVISTPIVDKEEFIRHPQRRERLGNRRSEGDDALLFVIDGDDYGDFWER